MKARHLSEKRVDEKVASSASSHATSKPGAGNGEEDQALRQSLATIAECAVRSIVGSEGAGLTLLEPDHPDTTVATAAFVNRVDSIQYSLHQGPVISATTEGHVIHSGCLGADVRWPDFCSEAARLGIGSAVSLPLITDAGIVGSMNVYSHVENAFDERATELGELFATQAAVALSTAKMLAQARQLAVRLQDALHHRALVERAIGIIMCRSGVNADEALQRLLALSENQQVKLTAMATFLVEESVRRARARHIEPLPHQTPVQLNDR